MTTGDRRTEKQERKAAQHALASSEAKARRIAELQTAFWNAPFGRARSAKAAGDRYFQVELALDSTVRSTGMVSTIGVTSKHHGDHGRALTDIEGEGWGLVHAGFVYKETGQVSRDKFLSSGQTVNTTGQTWGVYLFKATEEPARTDQPWLAWAEAEGVA